MIEGKQADLVLFVISQGSEKKLFYPYLASHV